MKCTDSVTLSGDWLDLWAQEPRNPGLQRPSPMSCMMIKSVWAPEGSGACAVPLRHHLCFVQINGQATWAVSPCNYSNGAPSCRVRQVPSNLTAPPWNASPYEISLRLPICQMDWETYQLPKPPLSLEDRPSFVHGRNDQSLPVDLTLVQCESIYNDQTKLPNLAMLIK